MADGHCFISYSNRDAEDFGHKLAYELEGGTPYIDAWFDKRDILPGKKWDEVAPDAIKSCKCLIFAMTKDSIEDKSICSNELDLALRYKKPILVLKLHDVEPPFRLADRQWIDFSNHKAGMARLRMAVLRLDSPEGQLDLLKERLDDANRDFNNAKSEEEKQRIQLDIDDLTKQIEVQQRIVDDPEAAKAQTQKNIEAGLERERRPEKPTVKESTTKFINPPPGIAPNYFQDRTVETEQVFKFLNDDSQRVMTIVGRGGVGKTAMVCRLLKGLEGGELPDGLGRMRVEGIVYLSESGSHRVNFANLFYDLCKLLPADAANALDAVYKNPQASTASKMSALLDRFTAGKVVLLLDNVEPLISVETFDIADAELDECLRALLHGAHSALKVILTTRVAPRGLNLCEPGRQRVLTLDSGLEQKYAVEMLREMDVDAKVGLKSATNEALGRACERTLGFPRALEALFAILASDRYTTLEELLAMPTPVNVVEALVGEAFNRLDTNAQKVMQALAVYNRPVTPAAVDYLLAPHLPAMDSAPILQRLANMHFTRKESGRFYLHPVDREFAFGLIGDGKSGIVNSDSRDLPIPHSLFTQHDLTSRAADYFAQARKPRAEWKKLDDLSAQLAEFDLRCAAGDYDTAASVLFEISFEYLLLWGHFRPTINLHLRLQGKIVEKYLQTQNSNGLGLANEAIGDTKEAIKYYKQGLQIAREIKRRSSEGAFLGNLGNAFSYSGDMQETVSYYEQALVIAREIGDRRGEANRLGNLGISYTVLGRTQEAIESLEQALVINRAIGDRSGESNNLGNLGIALLGQDDYQRAENVFQESIRTGDEISNVNVQIEERWGLSQIYLFQNDLPNARTTIEAALGYDVPQYNHIASALHGIIALRQGEEVAARGAFVCAIGQADEILSKTAEYYSALDAKGIALSGLAFCARDDGRQTVDHPTGTLRSGQSSVVYRQQAIETFRKARKIAPHAGIVKSVLRLFDELMKCEGGEILKDVRKAVEGKE